MNKKKYKFDTNTIHGGQLPDPATLSRAVPIYQTSSYLFKNTEHAARLFSLEEEGYIYTRIMNPTTEVFEKRMSLLENGIGALAVSSGQAAETLSILNIAGCGDEIISSSSLYGGTFNLFAYTFSKIGIKVNFVDPLNPDNFKKAITNKTKAIFAESVGNPKLDTLDFEEVSKIAHSHQIPLIIDSTFPTPYLINPIKWGADIVVHSATKFIGGHGTSIGGVIIDSGNFDWSCSDKFKELNTPDPSYHGIIYTKAFGKAAYIVKARVQLLRDLGPALSPFNAFLFLQGLETLPLRMKKHCKNALSVAEYLESNSNVTWVKYPGLKSHPSYHLAKKYHKNGFGAIIGFGIKGGLKSGQKFIENLKLFSHLANVGDAKSLAIHPATTTHQQLSRKQREAAGVTDDFIRLSIGLEDKDDLIDDLKQALEGT